MCLLARFFYDYTGIKHLIFVQFYKWIDGKDFKPGIVEILSFLLAVWFFFLLRLKGGGLTITVFLYFNLIFFN